MSSIIIVMQKLLFEFTYEKLALINPGGKCPEAVSKMLPDIDWLTLLSAAYAIGMIAFIIGTMLEYLRKELEIQLL